MLEGVRGGCAWGSCVGVVRGGRAWGVCVGACVDLKNSGNGMLRE